MTGGPDAPDRLVWDGQPVTDTTGSGGLTAAVLRWARQRGAGRQLQDEYRETFPNQPPGGLTRAGGWRAAAAHGATFEWALRTAGTNTDDVIYLKASRVARATRLAAAVPVDVIDGLLASGWTLNDLNDLRCRTGKGHSAGVGFGGTARRVAVLHRVAPEDCGPGRDLRWNAVAAVLDSKQAGLTDLQALRWMRVVAPTAWTKWHLYPGPGSENINPYLREWVGVAGPDGWVWPAAGYTLNETRVLRALPGGHPDQPGPDQLAVMAALRQT